MFVLLKEESYHYPVKLAFFLMIIFVFMPISWIDSGGSKNNMIGYSFVLLICTTFLFWKKTRVFLVIGQVLVFMVMLCVEHFYPQVIRVHEDASQFYDRLLQIPLLMLASFAILKLFADAYISEKRALDQLAHYDALTGLLNRRSFDEKLSRMIEQSDEKDLYLIFFDIDNFKTINDTKGHYYGDTVIKKLADHAGQVFDKYGLVCRWGGDEYAVIFTGSLQDLEGCLNNLYQSPVPISTGVVKFEGQDLEDLLKQVDRALYDAKEEGKNHYVIY
jgi:diguanylate cyclase (GGDEF)-like protein